MNILTFIGVLSFYKRVHLQVAKNVKRNGKSALDFLECLTLSPCCCDIQVILHVHVCAPNLVSIHV